MTRQTPWHGSILVRTGLILVAVLLLAGALALGLGMEYQRSQARQQVELRLNQLLDTVESTARVACFARDEILAAELAAGLLKNPEVLAVTIRADDLELVSQGREAGPSPTAAADLSPLIRDIRSPFAAELSVGQIVLTPDRAAIQDGMKRQLRVAMLQMALQLLPVALAAMIAMLLLITRPIQAISNRLHGMDATRGERLGIPAGHRNSEIGRLAADVNQLADRLVRALDEEHELRLRREIDERRYHAIFQNAETGIFLLDASGLLTSWNPAFARLLRLPAGPGRASALALAELGWADPARADELQRRCRDDNLSVSDDLPHRPDDGPERWLNVLLTPIGDRSLQGVVHDVTQHKTAAAEARRLAVTDRLTGLVNRLGLEQRLQEVALACRSDQLPGFTFILADLDDFKRFNEGFGLPAGDRILKAMGSRLSGNLKSTDTVARLGADQFALVLPGLVRDRDVEALIERLLNALRQPYSVAGTPVKLRASLGIAGYPRDSGDDLPTLILNAELALSQIKREGGNGAQPFDPLLAAAAARRHRLEKDLRQAIQERQFLLYLQPIVDLRENRLAGAEALIRWRHPERGLVPPDEFIPIAEDTGLIDEIGLWVLEAAGQQLADWRRRGERLSLSLNVSARQLPAALPPALLAETARRREFDPAALALEITEGVLLNDSGGILNWLTAVRGQGFPVYLDDFGTGYSSLSYLKRFPVDRLKVDKSFVRDIVADRGDRTLVEAVVAMAGSLELAVVAEGVEDAAQAALLRRMGCRYVQGYYFSPPVPIETFMEVRDRIPSLLADTELAA